jgi:hypothetical protein
MAPLDYLTVLGGKVPNVKTCSAKDMATKKRKPRKILDWWTDPRKPLWPHFAGMLLPFAICAFGL